MGLITPHYFDTSRRWGWSVAVLLVLLASQALAQTHHLRLYACAIANDSAGAFLGGSSSGSGLYQSDDSGASWKHLGWDNIKCYSMDMVPASNGRVLYLATGLGILRSTDYGHRWKQITGWRISEALDVAVDPQQPSNAWIATAHGPWRTTDGGANWEFLGAGLRTPYCSRVLLDSARPGQVLLAAEDGLFRFANGEWRPIPCYAEDSSFQAPLHAITGITQWKKESWLATSRDGFLLFSDDSGEHFQYVRDTSGGWCICHNHRSYVNITGGARGAEITQRVWMDSVRDIVENSIRNVSACLTFPYYPPVPEDIEEFDRPSDELVLLGTLDSGIALLNNFNGRDSAERGPAADYRTETQTVHRDFDTRFRLKSRQIWSLKSFLVTP